MIYYNGISIYLSATLYTSLDGASGEWLKSNDIFFVDASEAVKGSLNSYKGREIEKTYPIRIRFRDPKPLELIDSVGFESCFELLMYEDGYFISQLSFHTKEILDVTQVNAIINRGFTDQSFLNTCGTSFSYKGFVEFFIREFRRAFHIPASEIRLCETFSVIDVLKLSPEIDAEKIVETPEEIYLYAAAIRRIPHISEARTDLMRNEQVNVSSYKGDIIFVNYHNVFIHIVEGKGHLPSSFYIELVYRFKLLVAALSFIQAELDSQMDLMVKSTSVYRNLKKTSDWIDMLRFRDLRANEVFNKSIEIGSVRVKWFTNKLFEKFYITDKRNNIRGGIDEMEEILSRRVSLLRERQAQITNLTLTVISIIIAVIGIVIPVFLH